MNRLLYLNLPPKELIEQQIHYPYQRVITPTPQAARALKVPPYSLQSLAQQSLTEKSLKVAPVLLALRLLQNAVSTVIQTSDIEGTTRAIAPALKAILRAGVDLKALAGVGSTRTKQLAHVALAYTNLLRERALVDSTEVLWQASRVLTKRQPVLIYGYFHPLADELSFLNAVADDNSVMIIPCPESPTFLENQEAVKWLQQQGWEVGATQEKSPTLGDRLQDCFLNGASLPTETKTHIYPHLEAEVRGVLAQVKSLLSQEISANEIVLVARNDAFYGSTILDVAHEYKLPVRALYAVPLRETRLGAWIQLLLEIIQYNFPFESTAKLLSHPLCSGVTAPVWQEAQKLHPSNLQAWQGLGVDLSLLNWQQEDTRANWVQRLQDVLNQFELRKRAARWAREIMAFYKFQEALVDLAKPEEEVISLEHFVRDILTSLSLLTVPTQPGRGGVELHTPLSLFGAKFRYVFVLGATEGILPAPIQDDPMLDFYDRKQLRRSGFKLEDAAQAARREAISFYTLLQTPTQSLIFSYPQMIGKDASLPSPYLSQLGLIAEPLPLLPVASVEEARRVYLRREALLDDVVLPYTIHAWNVEKRREGAEPYDEYDGAIGLPLDPASRVFSASQLTALGQCPFRWFADKVLRLAELEEAEAELSPGLKGRLYHRSLELVLLPMLGVADSVHLGLQHLEFAFLQAEQDLQLPILPAWEARRAEHIKVLSRTLRQSDFWQQGRQVLALEIPFTSQWYGLKVTGRIDRVDNSPEGLILLDYKTSSHAPLGVKDESGKTSLDIQMPLYRSVANTTLFPGKTVEDACYYSVTKGTKLSKKAPTEEKLQAIAEQIKHNLQTGFYPVAPDIEQNVCRFCSYDLVCRKGSRQSRKGGVL